MHIPRRCIVEASRIPCCAVLQDVEKLGGHGDVVMVKPGRMRNHLYPKKEAVYAMYNAPLTVRERKTKVHRPA